MSESYLRDDLRDAVRQARAGRGGARKPRLRAVAGGKSYPVLRLWRDGFALDLGVAPQLRGFVDLYDGARHLSTCLVVASAAEGGEMIYEFKRNTTAAESPALDFARDEDARLALPGPG